VQTTSFRALLRSELAARCLRNSRYSVRAFARDLGVDHSTLSQWMRGRRPVTKETVETLGPKLNLPATQVRVYAEYAGVEGPDAAILKLARAPGFRTDSRWIAATLDINLDEANMAVHRLLRLGLLAMEERDRWVTKWDVR
jgi:transcriptional regulator with XRE-family HTH domain